MSHLRCWETSSLAKFGSTRARVGNRVEDVKSNVWIFQARPKRWNLTKKIPELLDQVGPWQANQHSALMEKGQKVFFWQAGKLSGIYGLGSLDGKSYLDKNELLVDVKYEKQFNPPILKASLLKHSVLKNLDVIKRPWAGTNFCVTEEECRALESVRIVAEQDAFAIQSQFPEGAVRRASVNIYERNPEARRECLQHYGYVCCVCEFNFEQTYGKHGAGFIHVHHLKQVAKRKKQYKVNPLSDLRPICPNCHAMIHKGSEMLKIEDLEKLIRKQKRK
jgi:5-methylcytosine-specific restriction protein A